MEIDKFLKAYVKKIVESPDVVEIEQVVSAQGHSFVICVAKADVGRVIGRDGAMISSIKAFISGVRAKSDLFYQVSVRAIEDGR